MKRTFFSLVGLAALGTLTVFGQQPPAAQPPRQTDVVNLKIIGLTSGLPPKLAIAGFVAASPDAETVAAAKTIGDVLYDDIAYEREFYMIAKDALATVPKPTSLDDVPLDRWKELNADGVLVGSIRKTASGVTVQVKLIQVSTGKTAFGKEYSGSIANPRQYAHTISDEIMDSQMQVRGVARTKLTFASDRDAERMKGPVANRDIKEIYFADYDGANVRRVTTTTTLNVAPMWSPDGQDIAYTSWRSSGAGGFGTFQDIIVSHIFKGDGRHAGQRQPGPGRTICAPGRPTAPSWPSRSARAATRRSTS